MLLSKFKNIYSPRPSRPTRNRIGLTRRDADGRQIKKREMEILTASSMRRPRIRIYPNENYGGVGVN